MHELIEGVRVKRDPLCTCTHTLNARRYCYDGESTAALRADQATGRLCAYGSERSTSVYHHDQAKQAPRIIIRDLNGSQALCAGVQCVSITSS